MSLPAGTTLGPYEIVAPLGAGGMGEVYRARDAKLGREVAIKVLAAHLAGDAHAIERLEREAKVLASASHPNIISIFDFGSSDGLIYVVMELLDGHTLRALLSDGALPVRRTVDYAIQIAQGLGAAHDRGIVHRDLKPENLFVTRDGHVKILDFGLARQHVLLGADETTLAQQTEPGTVLGTVGYMAPEQVQGKPADARSDIFAFGAVLYEMLSGRRAFKGQSAAETMHAILRDDPPDLLESVKGLPPGLDRTVGHCLEKSPELRFQSARDVAFNLESVSTLSSGSRGEALAVVPKAGSRRATAVALLAAGAVAGGVAVWALARTPAESPVNRRLTFDRGTVGPARFAPDGQTIIYSAAWRGEPSQIFTTRLDSRESRPLGLGHAALVAVSSAGELLVGLDTDWTYGMTLGRVPLAGGAPRATIDNTSFADWSSDGSDLAVVRIVDNEWRVEFPIGTIIYRATNYLSHLRVSPRGDLVAFIEHPPASGSSVGWLVVIDRTGSKRLQSRGWADIWGIAWRPDAREVWFTAAEPREYKSLRAVTLDGRERMVTRILGQTDLQDISRDGRVLVSRPDFRAELMAREPGASRERSLTWLGQSIVNDLSSNGGRVLFSESSLSSDYGEFVYLRPTDGSPAVRLGDGQGLALSPDGKWVVALTSDSSRLMVIPTGPGAVNDLTRRGFSYAVRVPGELISWASWLPDSRHVIFNAVANGGPLRLFVQDFEGDPRPVGPPGLLGQVISPDGRAVVAAPPGGPAMVYPLDGGNPAACRGLEKDEVAIQWSADGRSLLCRRPVGLTAEVTSVDIATGRRTFLWRLAAADPAGASAPERVVVTPDGKSYAYTFFRDTSDLYVIEGLR